MPHTQVLHGTASWGQWAPSALRNDALAVRAAKEPSGAAGWMTVLDVALLVLRAECSSAGICVPERFAPRALASAVLSVKRWREERRIFALGDLYPRYQFDESGRPHAPVERVIDLFGHAGAASISNWFSRPNAHLHGKRPRDLLSSDPQAVLGALQLH